MTSLTAFTVLVALVALERLAELVVSNRNAAWSFARGGRETGQGHYRFMVVLHSGFLVAMLVEAGYAGPRCRRRWPGRCSPWSWPPGPALVVHRHARPALEHPRHRRAGPAAGDLGSVPVLSHPNYVAVVVEGIALPLVHGRWVTALVFTVANAAVLLAVRIRVENAAADAAGRFADA